MKKLSFSELMNLLLLVVIAILIYQFKPKSNNVVIDEPKAATKQPDYINNNTTLKQMNDSDFKLPSPNTKGIISVEETLFKRRSRRDYENKSISSQQLSQVLWAAYGITQVEDKPAFLRGGLKTAPSAGARYPLDIYAVVGNASDLKPAVYKYIPAGHLLKKIKEGDFRLDLCKAALDQLMVKDAPVNLVYTATFERNTSKYGVRGRERYVCMDLGHSAENVYLQVEAIGLGTCAIGAFTDDKVSAILDHPTDEEPLYIMPIGYYIQK